MSIHSIRLFSRSFVPLLLVLTAACSDDGPTRSQGPGSLSGSVRTQEDQPLPQVRVELTREGADSMRVTQTDSEGRFGFSSLPAGTYRLRAVVPSGYEPPAQPVSVAVVAEQAATATVQVQALRVAEVTAAPGTRDSVALASGFVAEVDASGTSAPISLSVEQTASGGLGEFQLVAPVVSVTAAGGGAASGAARARAIGADEGGVSVRVWQRVPQCTGAPATVAFEVSAEAGAPPIFLFAESSCTTYTDPSTGATGAAYLAELSLPPGHSTNLGLFTSDTTCPAGVRSLYAAPGTAENDALTPLILIHGWQPTWTDCEDFEEWEAGEATFGGLLDALADDPELAARYQPYILRYPTFEPIANTSAFLRQEIESRGWQNREIAIVGHSMGGLVGRGYVAAHGAEHLRALVTLGTPHLGSPLARGDEARARAIRECSIPGIGGLVPRIIPETAGYNDLNPDGAWIQALREQRAGAERIYTLAGELEEDGIVHCVLNRLTDDAPSDGVVPVASALPDWTTLQTVVEGARHQALTGGGSIPHVRDVLKRLDQCRPGEVPAPPASNAFPLSGTLARLSDGRIDVVLNPIMVDGEAVSGLTEDNFTIIENHCIKDFNITTDEGNLGVDLVFIQDLSGSMSGAITGVRNSVLAFADDLRSRGLNVLIGSVGYSGPGTIVTGGDPCEALGPVQNLTSPAAFRNHVAATWVADGGCDEPENALEAVEYAHRTMTWRAGAARVYILITDVSIHTATTTCNGTGPCTDQTLESIVELVGGTSTLHAVAPASAYVRTYAGGLDPWLLADRLGGARLDLGSGVVNLNTLGIADQISEIVRLSFTSTSTPAAHHRIRVRVQVDGRVAEISPGLIQYDIHPSLRREPRR